MTPSLESGVERRLESPVEGEVVRLIVQLESNTDEAVEQLQDSCSEIHDQLPLRYYSVSVPETELVSFCDRDILSSVEIDSEAETFESDFLSHRG